jgi:thioredoxin-related protein
MLLYFGQDGCPYCRRLMEVNFRHAEIAKKARQHFVALALNIWGDREVTWTDGTVTTGRSSFSGTAPHHRPRAPASPTLNAQRRPPARNATNCTQ